jgi:hypothetical protein
MRPVVEGAITASSARTARIARSTSAADACDIAERGTGGEQLGCPDPDGARSARTGPLGDPIRKRWRRPPTTHLLPAT